jgi:hypothetical protein
MATIDEQRHQMIRRIVMRWHESSAADMILLWERLACELTAIIGHAGFYTLYGRAAHLASTSHAELPTTAGTDFAVLREYLLLQTPDHAAEINITLLTIFIDTLIRLIGEPLTTTILHSAWGTDAVDTAGKEPQQ